MVHLHRIETEGLAQVSFIVAARNGDALVIDPRRDVGIYLDLAQAHGLTLRYVADTHIHADYASGAPELTARTGARLLLRGITNGSGASDPDDPWVAHGGVLELGELRITALQTPGHTPEHRCFLLEDSAEPTAPAMLFSGDTLFVGSVGRPDLLGADETQALAAAMHTTLQTVLLPLPDATIVYPGHGAGSACGGGIGGGPSTTIGQERVSNPYFQFGPGEAECARFVALLLRDLPPVPTYFPLMKRLNAAGAAPAPDALPPVVAPAELRTWQHADAPGTLLDVRDADSFAAGHLRGALNIGVGGSMATWAGWALPYERLTTVIAQHHDQVREAQTWLARIGYDAVSGYALLIDTEDDTLAALRAEGLDIQQMRTVTPAETQQALADADAAPQILDIRAQSEWDEAHIPGSIHHPLEDIAQAERGGADSALLPSEVDVDAPLLVVCASGYRSSLAASLLQRAGVRDVGTIAGGVNAWRAAGLPIDDDAAGDSA